MTITEIKQQKNNQKRYSIYIDDEFAFGLDEIDVLYYKLKVGEDISESKKNEIIENVIFTKAKDKAIKFLGSKARSKKEIVQKLKAYDYPDDIIYKVIDLLSEYGYINDRDLAENYAKDIFKYKGYGSIRISFELSKKGIDSETIKGVLESLELDEVTRASEILEAQLDGDYELDYKEKQKIFNFMMRKGYSYSIIKDALCMLSQNNT